MSCPYFDPLGETWDQAVSHRLPLGQAYRGSCSLQPSNAVDRDTQVRVCNSGYARGRCLLFPESEAIDAIRFSLTRSGGLIWIEEAGHRPLHFGVWTAPSRSQQTTLRDRQALAFSQAIQEGKVR